VRAKTGLKGQRAPHANLCAETGSWPAGAARINSFGPLRSPHVSVAPFDHQSAIRVFAGHGIQGTFLGNAGTAPVAYEPQPEYPRGVEPRSPRLFFSGNRWLMPSKILIADAYQSKRMNKFYLL